MYIIYKGLRGNQVIHFSNDDANGISGRKLSETICSYEGIHRDHLLITLNGKVVYPSDIITDNACCVSYLKVLGGKGGFGSMLRALGARIEKTTNHEACRDLSGRRMRDVNNEKKIGDWLKNKEQEEDERKKKREEKLKRILNPKHTYTDTTYTSSLQDNADKVDEALKFALKKRKQGDSSNNEESTETNGSSTGKKQKMWLGLDEDLSGSDDESESDDGGQQKDTNSLLAQKEGEQHNEPEDKTEDNESSSLEESATCSTVETNDRKKRETKEASFSAETASLESTEKSKEACSDPSSVTTVDLSQFSSAEQLESVGLEALKRSLIALGMKCGGTLQERAHRLFLTKDTPLSELDKSLFAKPKKNGKKN